MRRLANPLAKSFWSGEHGAVAATYALALVPLIAMAGVGMDYARLMGMDSELQNGADQAALAAASQLDGKSGACTRASTAARSLVVNTSLLTSDDNAITFTEATDCSGSESIMFWQDKAKTNAATSDANANFVEVLVDVRGVDYALLPVTGALRGELQAAALAGLGSAICKVPPIMICHPDPGTPFNADARKGQGIAATGHSTGKNKAGGDAGTTTSGTKWSPGNFGFLQIPGVDGDAGNKNARLLTALAFNTPQTDCISLENNKVSTGNPQGLYDAINTRFDLYDFPSNGGSTLAPCQGGACLAAPNVTKDFIRTKTSGNNSCKVGNNGWELPKSGSEFKPVASGSWSAGKVSANNPTVMGLPRDNCHYTSFNGTGLCGTGTGRFGDGNWAREDYFAKNHATPPPGYATMTRYETYLWEIANDKINNTAPQSGKPVCSAATGPKERRVLSIAVVTNCAELSGTSTPVNIEDFVDVFLVEPSVDDAKRYNAFKDVIYFEIIGKSQIAGNGVFGSQEVRRDVPYLIE
ncbi:pilus assembly protein [Altererythrobacter aurantiacus]|uniref:Pilus assembly protein n=1 Tax=Parapontixanthobacter aurantiacus TaxID=1463599 RepID=A0A844ZFC0_9SPHN|nr:pilus assembly protein TadG-related protein [Parapontixanthobacter aurantiacus]MXO86003.1 pilus assembly protein [Parapontixanthobacter aurantiacus]